jgi:TonB family protein
MIPRILVPEKLNPVDPNAEEPKKPRRLTTLLDDRTVVPSGGSSAPPLDRKSSIPSHFPLDVLVPPVLVPRGMEAKQFGEMQPLSEFVPIAILDSRVVVPAYVEPATAEDTKEFHKPREMTPELRAMVEPDIYLTGEANLLVEPEQKRAAKWDVIFLGFAIGFHILLLIFLLLIPKMFPAHVPTNEEIRDASELLGKVYIPPGDIPKSTPPAPKVHVDRRILNKVAPPRPEEHAPVAPAAPQPTAPKPELPEAPKSRVQPDTVPVQPQPEQPKPSELEPIHPTQPTPNKLNLGLPSQSPGDVLRSQVQDAMKHGSSPTYSQEGSGPRGAGAGRGGPGMGSGVQILTPTEGVDFNSYIQRLLAAIKRNWEAVMPESALMGDRGVVGTTLQINSDGTLLVTDPTLERSSGKEPLDAAALSAIKASAPFEPLPPQFHGPFIRLRITFLYNIPRSEWNQQ